MTEVANYSTYFHCLYDQPKALGSLGRGAHYSIFRAVERFDVELKPALVPQIHDFAVIWDEDHDTRVIAAIESLYMHDLLAPVQFVGERKGFLTLIIAARSWSYMSMSEGDYLGRVKEALGVADIEDSWAVDVGMFDRNPGSPHQRDSRGLISASDFVVNSYLVSIDAMWRLGTRPWAPVPPRAPWDAPELEAMAPFPSASVVPPSLE